MRFNTQPPEGGCTVFIVERDNYTRFQHTAARRRLPLLMIKVSITLGVSTHSRPKAAALDFLRGRLLLQVSTHSRPKAAALGSLR